MLVIAYGILALTGVGVYLIGFCFFELGKIHQTLVERNEIAAAANKMNEGKVVEGQIRNEIGRVASALEALNDTYESSQPGYHEDTAS